MTTYKIVRHYFRTNRKVDIKKGLTLEQAQAHCKDPETSSTTCKLARHKRRTKKDGPWFDAFTKEV